MTDDFDWWVFDHNPETKTIWLHDHFGTFNSAFRNPYLDQVPSGYTVYSEYLFPDEVHKAYPDLQLKFSAFLWLYCNSILPISVTAAAIDPPPLEFENFLVSFFRSNKPEGHAIMAKLGQQGLFNPEFSTKHFVIDRSQVERYGLDFDSLDQSFVDLIVKRDFVAPTDHPHNLSTLSPAIQKSFLHLVVETRALETTVCFPTEKFLYAVANRRLWLAVAPPNFHKMISQQFNFQLHSCFDYYFDCVWDDQLRLNLLLEQVQRFANLTHSQQQELYRQQQTVLDTNYQRLVSGQFFDDIVAKDQYPNMITKEHLRSHNDAVESKFWLAFLESKTKKR